MMRQLQKNLQECYNGEDAACEIVLFDGIVNSLVGHTDEAHNYCQLIRDGNKVKRLEWAKKYIERRL